MNSTFPFEQLTHFPLFIVAIINDRDIQTNNKNDSLATIVGWAYCVEK